jgi:aminopeptidase
MDDPEQVQTIPARIDAMKANDLVIGIQTSNSYQLNEYRLRIELFRRKIKSVDHVHLGIMPPSQYATYIDSLAFDHRKDGPRAHRLKSIVDQAKRIVVTSGPNHDAELIYESTMEPSLLNLGDYAGMENVGGTFPVGEVFSEPHDLTAVNGDTYLFAYPSPRTRCIEVAPEPFRIRIERGVVVDYDAAKAPGAFVEMLNLIRALEQDAVVREFGLGLNRAANASSPLNDVTAFERQLGLHFSCGKKHNVFKKPGMKKNTRMHVDLFVDLKKMAIDNQVVFSDGDFIV